LAQALLLFLLQFQHCFVTLAGFGGSLGIVIPHFDFCVNTYIELQTH